MKFSTEQLDKANKIACDAARDCGPGEYHGAFIEAAAGFLLEGMIVELDTANRSLESALKERDDALERLALRNCVISNPSNPTPSRYQFEFQGVRFDVYRLLEILGITHHAQAHAFKKVIRAGRGHKSVKQDIEEAKQALTRWAEMLDEDGKAPDHQLHR